MLSSSSAQSLFEDSLIEDRENFATSTMIAENVICKVIPCVGWNSSREDVLVREDNSPSREALHFSYELLHHVLTRFLSPLPRFQLSSRGLSSLPFFLRPCAFSNSRHPGIASMSALIETDYEAVLIQKYLKDSILSLPRLSKSMSCASLAREAGEGAKDMRLRFVIYQLLQVVAYTHSLGLCVDLSVPEEVTLSKNVWVSLGMRESNRMSLAAECVRVIERCSNSCSDSGGVKVDASVDASSDGEVVEDIDTVLLNSARVKILLGSRMPGNGADSRTRSGSKAANFEGKIERPPGYYEPITLKWVSGKVSNLHYLFAINTAAGRYMIDPGYHPVLPWVTDFSSEVTPGRGSFQALRDLTKTKFRLSKGDQQLETTFEHSNPPHHIPAIMSELTYYIYMARRTPMQMLKRIVRGYFVADHYPHSMNRMYNWTPDECAPEFYTDATIFESIHKKHGLENIGLPSFAPTPEEFLVYHRSILESDEVSSQLHHWIDLTFGYKLIGSEAESELNVPLVHALSKREELGASPELRGHPGFKVMFDRPHPKKDIAQIKHHKLSCKPTKVGTIHQMDAPVKKKDAADRDRDVSSMLEMGDTYGIVSTPYLELPNEESLKQDKLRDLKFLSEGNIDDKSLSLLKFAKTGTLGSSGFNDNLWCSAEALKFSTIYSARLEPWYELPFACENIIPDNPSCTSGKHTSWDKEFQAQSEEYYKRPLTAEDAKLDSDLNLLVSFAERVSSTCEMEDVGAHVKNVDGPDSAASLDPAVRVSAKSVIQLLQAQDMFAMGCLIAEVFTGNPLLSEEAASSHPSYADMQMMLHTCIMQCESPVPLNIRRLILLLIHPHPVYRPSASDILKLCCVFDNDSDYDSVTSFQDGVLSFETCANPVLTKSFSSLPCRNLLEDFCYYTFPSHFRSAYTFIGRLKIAQDGLSKLRAVSSNLIELGVFSLEGVSLVLPHILEVISDPTPFQQHEETAKSLKKPPLFSSEKVNDYSIQELIDEHVNIINVLGDRLGSVNTASLLMPQVTKLLQSLNSSYLLSHFIQSRHLWVVILSHAGPKCFLRHVLPILLTYLVSGSLQATPRAMRLMCPASPYPTSPSSSSPLGAIPLWATEEKFKENRSDEWLHSSRKDDLLLVQEGALRAMLMLSLPEALGTGLCSRYVLPALLCLVASPRFSIAGFGITLDDADYNMTYSDSTDEGNATERILVDRKSFLDLLSNKITLLSEYDERHMFAVRAILGICHAAGELVITRTVLPKIFGDKLPRVFANILDVYMPDMPVKRRCKSNNTSIPVESNTSGPFLSAMLEIIALLRGLLTMLSPNSIRSFYFNTERFSDEGGEETEGVSLLTLLVILPLPFINPDVIVDSEIGTEDSDHSTVMRLLEFRQRHTMFIELCRLITVAASQVGSDTIHNTILPAVNKFFTKFVHTYCDLDVRSDLMALAFEIGRSLYFPLVQLVGAGSFSTSVPEVNPRLEVWLLHATSTSLDSNTRNSELNVLPDTIFPLAVSRQDAAPPMEPEKEKSFLGGFMSDWLAPSPPRKTKPDSTSKVNKEAEARLNQQMDDAMRDAIAQQEVHRRLVRTPMKECPKGESSGRECDSDDDSVCHPVTLSTEMDGIESGDENDDDDDDDNSATSFHVSLTLGSHYNRNQQTKSIVHYEGNNPFYHSLHTFITDVDALIPSEKVFFKYDSNSKSSLSLVNCAGKLIQRVEATSFHPTRSASAMQGKPTEENVMSHFKKAVKATIQRSPSVGSKGESGHESDDDDDNSHTHSAKAWLLGGSGRWLAGATADTPADVSRQPSKPAPSSSIPAANKPNTLPPASKNKPAATISMASPKVLSDVASEASELFSLDMVNETSWAFDALAFKANASGPVTFMLADPTERFLVAATKDGEMKVWSLMANPVVELMKYSAHQTGVYSAGFLKSGTHVASCDGSIRIWDIQTGMTIADIQRSHSELGVFNHIQVVSPRLGVGSDMSKHGDDQLMTCAGAVLAHYDLRAGCLSSLHPISEWKVSNGISKDHLTGDVMLTCSASNEDYVVVGSIAGTLWSYERRTGRPIHCWTGHEGSAVLKIQYIDHHHIITISERNSYCWNLQGAEPKRVYQIKGLPDCSSVMNANTIIMQTYDNPASTVACYEDLGTGQKSVNMMYCMAGHKISSGILSSGGNKPKGPKELGEADIRLTKSYFNDYNHVKLTKSRLQISSACVLPLRKMLLLGTSDGLIRAVV